MFFKYFLCTVYADSYHRTELPFDKNVNKVNDYKYHTRNSYSTFDIYVCILYVYVDSNRNTFV
jgi:hypothetical protein